MPRTAVRLAPRTPRRCHRTVREEPELDRGATRVNAAPAGTAGAADIPLPTFKATEVVSQTAGG